MTRDEIVQIIRDRLGFNQSLELATIYRHMDAVQRKFELGEDDVPAPWFCFDTTCQLKTRTNRRDVALPETFTTLDDDWPLSIEKSSTVTKALTRVPYYDLVSDIDSTGFPQYYALEGEALHLFPLPDSIYNINFPHHKTLEALSTDADSIWFKEFPNLLIEETVSSIASSTRDHDALKMSRIVETRSAYIRRVESRKHTLQSYRMGNDA